MSTDRVRTTISLSPEALEVFKRMADAGNMSVSRCMGDWLIDTADAAEMLTLKMEEAKRAPLKVMREMRAMVAGLGIAVDETEDEVRRRSAATGQAKARLSPATLAPGLEREPLPPSSNTGGKSPKTQTPRTQKKGSK